MKRLTIGAMGISLLCLCIPANAGLSVYTIHLLGSAPYYDPKAGEVIVGQPIQWKNSTGTIHTITHDGCFREGPCAFDSGPVAPNATFSLYHLKPGVYHYYCRLHPIMRGRLIIRPPKKVFLSS